MVITRAAALAAYKKMHMIRIAEERLVSLYLEHKIMSFVHFYIGQEAVAVGVADSLSQKDKMVGNHRSHGHYLAKGGNLRAMICELLGKQNGSSHGKGGSMHMIDRAVNFAGSTPILGSVVSIACGSAFAQKCRQQKNITVAFLGDGAFEEGGVYESLNLAGLFKVPLLLVVENNLHAVNTTLNERRAKGHDSKAIVQGLGARYSRADGNDYYDVRSKSELLARYVRSGRGPAVLECVTYRHMAHSAPIFDESRRREDIIAARQAKDSVKKLRAQLSAVGVSERTLLSLERGVKRTVNDAIRFAQKSSYPKRSSLTADLYA